MRLTSRRQGVARYGVTKITNEYAQIIDSIYGQTPKAVLAALAVSFAAMVSGEADTFIAVDQKVVDALLEEWRLLHQAGVITQPPCKLPARLTTTQHERAI